MDFYGRTGSVVCYSPDGEHLYLWAGNPVGYLSAGKVYSFGGRQLGWFENGWLYDRSNRPALFSPDATGGPVKPVKQVKPVKGVRQLKPLKALKQIALNRPVKSSAWSPVSDATYFQQ